MRGYHYSGVFCEAIRTGVNEKRRYYHQLPCHPTAVASILCTSWVAPVRDGDMYIANGDMYIRYRVLTNIGQ